MPSSPTPPSTSSTTTVVCPNCSATASGRVCSMCGTLLEGARCAACGADLMAGARFCHRCGTAIGVAGVRGGARPRGLEGVLPWAVAGIALVALVALVAGQRFGARDRGTDAPQGGALGGGAGALGVGPAPDISNMTPREQAERLFNRVMVLDMQRQQDSTAYRAAGGDERLRFFGTMAIQAYQRVTPVDADVRYDMGQVALVTGATPLARAQADSILRDHPDHLLGLILAARAARQAGDEPRARQLERRLLDAQTAEREKNLPEYERHGDEIQEAIQVARQRQP